MKFLSWNVNGLRACMKKGFAEFFKEIDADIFAIQETKMQENQKDFAFENYYEFWSCAEKAGYSGTLIYSKQQPTNVIYGINGKYNDEGRAITLEFENFYFVTVYSPNSKEELARLDYRMAFEDELRNYLVSLAKSKPTILCGDLNVAHNPIDLKNPKPNEQRAGYSIEERTKFGELLKNGFVDSFRYLYPEKVEYSWWSYRFSARKNNAGWRIDYFVVSDSAKDKILDSKIHTDILGSDHCPVELDIEL